MDNIKKWVSFELETFDDVVANYGFNTVSDLLNSEIVIYHDRTIDGLLCGVGMDQEELEKKLYRGSDTLGYSQWSLYYLHFHDQYILINEFY